MPDTHDDLKQIAAILVRGLRRHYQNRSPRLHSGAFALLHSPPGANTDKTLNTNR
jgi:hypothetical protein